MTVTHADVERLDLVDRYIAGRLDPAECEAFEDHFFSCDRCFADVRDVDRLKRAIRRAAARGVLDRLEPGLGSTEGWLATLSGRRFVAAVATVSIALAIATLWLALAVVPSLRHDLARAQSARRAADDRATAAATEVRRQADAARAQEVASAAEANVPVAILQTVRGAAAVVRVTAPTGARHLIIWIESATNSRGPFRLTIERQDGTIVQTVDGLTPNADGALAAAIPLARLGPDTYLVRIHARHAPAPVGEYRLAIVR